MKQMASSKKQRLRLVLRWLPAAACMAVIYWFSSRTGDQLQSVLPWFQAWFPGMSSFNWGHLVAYFLLALMFDYALGHRADRWSIKGLIVFLCFLYGISDEYHQSFVSGRMPDASDLLNDTIGAMLAVLLVKIPIINRFWRRIAK